jgi:thymidylate synthase (FAD)
LEYRGHSNRSVVVYGARLCWQSFARQDDLGPNDRKLLSNLVKRGHYSPLNLLWYKFEKFSGDQYLTLIGRNQEFQSYMYYDPNKEILLINARTLKHGQDRQDEICLQLIDQVIDDTPVIFGDTEANLAIREESISPIDVVGYEYVKLLDKFENLYFLEVKGISRALFHEWVRHRQMLCAKSTRYTLKELADVHHADIPAVAERFIVHTGDYYTDRHSCDALWALWENLNFEQNPNDIIKYNLPECYRTHLVTVIPDWSLDNMLKLREGNAALWEWKNWVPRIREATGR